MNDGDKYMKKNVQNISNSIFYICNYTAQALFSLMCIYPFYYIFINSISDPLKAGGMNAVLLPAGFSLEAYAKVFKMKQIYTGFLVSSSRAVVGTIVTVFICSMLAYALTKKELVLRKFIYRVTVSSMYLAAGLIPWYITMKAYGLKNNFLLYILPAAVSPFLLILIKTYMEQIPPSLEESALIDGAGYFTIYAKIIFPVSIPVIAAVAVFSGVGQWNAWSDNFFLVSSSKLQTIQLILLNVLRESQALATAIMETNDYSLAKEVKITPTVIRMTITVIVVIPIMLLYPFLQKYFVKGIMLGAVKG